MNYYAQKVKQHKPLLLLCAILLVLCCLPAIIAAADDAVVWDNATEITISASTTSSLTVCWPEAVGAENYTVTYDKKWSGVSDKQTVSDATWSAEGYVISGLSECSRYDITVTPNMDNPVTTSAIGVTSSTKTGFVFVPISSFSGTTAPGRYQSMPMAANTVSSDFVDVYTLSEDVTIGVDSVFSWYLQAGFNKANPRDHISGIRLFNLTDNQEIALDYGDTDLGIGTSSWPAVSNVKDGTFTITNQIVSGDFEWSKISASSAWVRLRVNIDNYLEEGKDYAIALDPSFHTGGGSPSRLNKVYEYRFSTKTTSPEWPEDAVLSVSNVGSSTATLNWPIVTDTSLASGYALYVNGVLEDNSIPVTQYFYEMEGLLQSKSYTFEIAAKPTKGRAPQNLSATIVTGGKLALTFVADPLITVGASTDYTQEYSFAAPVDPDNFYLSWNFSKGIDKSLEANLAGIRIYNKATKAELTLDKGQYPYIREDLTGNIIAGDFKYTKLGGGGGTGGELRMLSFEPTLTTLAQFSEGQKYVLEMQPEFVNNNGENTLGKILSFEFSIAGDDSEAPVWPLDAVITPSAIGPTSMAISWPEATDNSGFLKEYQIVINGGSMIRTLPTVTTFQMSVLTKLTNYNIVINAVDSNNNKSADLILNQATVEADTTAPIWGADKKLTVSNIAVDNLDLAWTETSDDIGLAGYKVYQNNVYIKTVAADVRKLHVTGLLAKTSYTFRVEAYDTSGNTTSNGPVKLANTLDGVPDTTAPVWGSGGSSTSISSKFPNVTITLTWPWASDDTAVTGYDVYCERDYVGTVSDTVNSFTTTRAIDGNRYTYQVYAVDPSGNRSSEYSFAEIYTGDPDQDLKSPTWPTGSSITLSEFTEDTVVVKWTAANDNVGVTNYLVKNGQLWIEGIFQGDEYPGYFSFNDRTYWYTPITTALSTHQAEKIALVVGKPTTLSIKAFDAPQNSTMGDPTITFYPGSKPTAGSGIDFVLSNVANTRGTLNSISGAVNYVTDATDPVNTVLEFSFDGTLDTNYADKFMLTDTDSGLQIPLTDKISKEQREGKDVVVVSIVDSTTLGDGKTYKIVVAKDLATTTGKKLGLPIAWEFTTAVRDKEAPTFADEAALTVEFLVAPDVATLSWPQAADNVGVTGYIIKQGGVEVATVADNILTYDVKGLSASTPYTFTVEARDFLNNISSTPLDKSVNTPAANSSKPVFSGAMSFTAVSSDNLMINWTAATSPYAIKEYEVYQGASKLATVAAAEVLSYQATGLAGETEYNFSVIAKDYSGNDSEALIGTQTTAVDIILPLWPES